MQLAPLVRRMANKLCWLVGFLFGLLVGFFWGL
jgi:hypothetical protein